MGGEQMLVVRVDDRHAHASALSTMQRHRLLTRPPRLRIPTLAQPSHEEAPSSGADRPDGRNGVNDLTPFERRIYRSGQWLWDAEHGPRCRRCGCLEDNHAWTKDEGWGRCEVCGCPEYEFHHDTDEAGRHSPDCGCGETS